MKDDDVIKQIREHLKIAQDHDNENHERAEKALKFKVGDQWDEQAKAERREQMRPMMTINKLRQYVRQVVNEFRRGRPGVLVRPVDSEDDKEKADIFSGLIRHIENQSNAEAVYDHGCEQAVDGGFGYWRILTDYVDDTAFEQEIFIKRIKNRFTVYLDPNAQEADRSDIKWAIVTEKMTKAEFKRKYPKAKCEGFEAGKNDDWMAKDDVRVAEYWVCEPEKRELVLLTDGQTLEVPKGRNKDEYIADLTQHVYEETGQIVEEQRSRVATRNKITQYIVGGHEVLEKNDWAGKYIPIIMVVGDETNVEGKDVITGIIEDAKDAQQMYNYHRSASVEFVSQAPKAPWLVTPKQVQGHERFWNSANRANLPYLLYNHDDKAGKPNRVGLPTTPTGLVNEAMIASDDMQAAIGIYDSSLGKRSNETSGIAIAKREEQADTGTFHYLDNMNRAIAHTGRVLVDLIPKIYDTARQVRILNIDQTERFVPINQEYEDPQTGEIKLHDLSTGRFDIYTEAGNTFATKREETKSLMLDILGSAGQYAPAILPLLLKNIDMDGAEDALEAVNQINQMQGLTAPGQQPNQPPMPGQQPNQPMPPGMMPQGFPQ